MTDELNREISDDPTMINIHREREVKNWAEWLEISTDELKEIVRKAGPRVIDVIRALKSKNQHDG